MQRHALGDGRLDLVRAGRHFAALFEADHVDVLCPLAQGGQRHVDGDVATADDNDTRADLDCFATAHIAQEVDATQNTGLVHPLDGDETRELCAEAKKHCVIVLAEGIETIHLGAGMNGNIQRLDLFKFLVEQLGWQAIGGNAIAQHAAGFVLCLEDFDGMAEDTQVISGREAGGAGADDTDPLAGGWCQLGARVAAFSQAMLGRHGLHRSDENRTVVAATHADRLAGRRADQTTSQRQGIVTGDDFDRLGVITVADMSHETRDVDIGRTGAVAGGSITLQAQPFGTGFVTGMTFPLVTEIAQRAAQRPSRSQPLRGKFERQLVEFGQMPHLPMADRNLGHQTGGARQQGTYRCRLILGQLPVAIQRTARLLDQADTLSQHHHAGGRRGDTRSGERQRMTGQVGLREWQETSHAVVEDQHRIAPFNIDTTTPIVDEPPQHVAAFHLNQATLFQATPQGQQCCIDISFGRRGEQQSNAAPGFRRVDKARAVGGMPFTPATRQTVAPHLNLQASPRRKTAQANGIEGVEQPSLATRQFGGEAQFNLAGIAQASSNQETLGQQPGRTIEHGGHAAGAGIQAGRIHHQHGSTMATQKLPPGVIQGLTGAAALGQPGLL